jgi:inorganic triphosphatase YgiF
MSTGGNDGASAEEREVKLAVGEDFELPALTGLDGVVVVDRGDQTLRSVYWDTAELGLAHAGVGLRHRNGVWAYKGRSRREGAAVVREELELNADGAIIPPGICARVRGWVEPAALRPVAELDTVRHQVDVACGASTAELVHDRVRVLAGERVVASFAEVEVEHGGASQELADRLVSLLVASGAVVDATPKFVRALRALGHDPPEVAM